MLPPVLSRWSVDTGSMHYRELRGWVGFGGLVRARNKRPWAYPRPSLKRSAHHSAVLVIVRIVSRPTSKTIPRAYILYLPYISFQSGKYAAEEVEGPRASANVDWIALPSVMMHCD